MSESTTASGADESTTPNEVTAANAEIKSELEQLRNQNSQLMGRLDQLTLQGREPKAQSQKQYSPEEYKELMEKDPAKAIQLAVSSVVDERVQPLVNNMRTESAKRDWDSKAENDFPAIKSDREFKKLVTEQMADLINTDGLSKDHPTLLYRAAQIAASKLDRKPDRSKGGMSGEAPNHGEREGRGGAYKVPEYFDSFSSVFNLSDESKKRLAAKMEAQSKQQRGRR